MKIHEIIGENRVKFAARLLEMSEELTLLTKEVEKNRKGVRFTIHVFRHVTTDPPARRISRPKIFTLDTSVFFKSQKAH